MSVFEAWMSALRATKSTFLVLDERFRAWRSDDGVQEIETRCFRCLSLPRLLTGRARDGDESRVRMPGRRCVLPAAGTLVAAALCCACVGVAGIELDDVMAALPAETRALLSKQNAEVMAMTDTICAPRAPSDNLRDSICAPRAPSDNLRDSICAPRAPLDNRSPPAQLSVAPTHRVCSPTVCAAAPSRGV